MSIKSKENLATYVLIVEINSLIIKYVDILRDLYESLFILNRPLKDLERGPFLLILKGFCSLKFALNYHSTTMVGS